MTELIKQVANYIEPAAAITEKSSSLPWLKSVWTQRALEQVTICLTSCVAIDPPYVGDICGHLIRAGGKGLRPALLLLSAEFGDHNAPGIIDIAVAVELLHVATLYHDDIMDEAIYRRHRPTTNLLWGNRASAFAGTYLFSRAIRIFAMAGSEANQIVTTAVANLWYGQSQESERSYDLDMDEESYLKIIENKTMALCELPCRLGALQGSVLVEKSHALVSFGRKLGMAFQIIDDVLDLVGEEQTLGKMPGTDLLEGVYTLPVLYCLNSQNENSTNLRSILRSKINDRDQIKTAISIIESSGSIEQSIGRARRFAEEALIQIDDLPSGKARDSLVALVGYLIDRPELSKWWSP